MALSKTGSDFFSINLINSMNKGNGQCTVSSLALGEYLKWVPSSDSSIAAITHSGILSSKQYKDVPDPDRTHITFVYTDLGDSRFQLQPLYKIDFYLQQAYFGKEECIVAQAKDASTGSPKGNGPFFFKKIS